MSTIARSPLPVSPTRRVLPPEWVRFREYGDEDGNYRDPHAAAKALAVAYHRAGLTLDDWVADMSDPTYAAIGGFYGRRETAIAIINGMPEVTPSRGRSWHEGRTRMVTDWHRAVAYATTHPQVHDVHELSQQLALIRLAMDDADWSGRTGRRNRIVLGVLLDYAETKATITPTISVRSLSEHTPYKDCMPICRALDQLAEAGWFVRDRKDRTRAQPTMYRLQEPQGGAIKRQDVEPPARGTGVLPRDCTPRDAALPPPSDMNPDLSLALGPCAALIYAALLSKDALRKRAIVERSGVSKRTVDKWLDRLARLGLARQSPDGWLRTLTDPVEVAAEQGAVQIHMDRSEKIAKRRELFHKWIEDREADVVKSRRGRPSRRKKREQLRRPGV